MSEIESFLKGFGQCALAQRCDVCKGEDCAKQKWIKYIDCFRGKCLNSCLECDDYPCGGLNEKVCVMTFINLWQQHDKAV